MLTRALYLIGVVGAIFILIGLLKLVGIITIGSATATSFIVIGAIVLVCVWLFTGGPYGRRTPL